MVNDLEKSNYEMPTDVANAIKDLQPSIKAKIEEVFKAYDAFEDLDSSINKLDHFFNGRDYDIYISNIRTKYRRLHDLTSKLLSICKENGIGIHRYDSEGPTYVVEIASLIKLRISYHICSYQKIMGQNISVQYIGDKEKSKGSNKYELRKEAAQICELLMNEL